MSRRTLKLSEADEQMNRLSEIQSMQNRLLGAAYNAIGESDIQEIVRSRVEAAKSGDKTAIDFVFKYLLGRDGGTINLHKHETTIVGDVETAARLAKSAG